MLRPAPDSPPAKAKRAPEAPALSEVEKGSGNEPPPREMLRLSRGSGAEAPIRCYRRTPVVTDGHGAKVCRQMHSVIIRQAPSLRLSPRQDGIQVFGPPTHSCTGGPISFLRGFRSLPRTHDSGFTSAQVHLLQRDGLGHTVLRRGQMLRQMLPPYLLTFEVTDFCFIYCMVF